MTDTLRIRIAAAATALFLAGISAAGLTHRDHRLQPATPAASPAVVAAPATAAVRETERVVESSHDD
jgi:hypothetical protein